MGFLVLLLTIAACSAVLLIWCLTAGLVAWLVRTIRRLLGFAADTEWPDSLSWPIAILGILSLAGGVVGAALVVPDYADTRVLVEALRGYPATRITVELQQTDDASREALLETMTPLMATHHRSFSYRVQTRRGGYISRADLVSRYRFVDRRLEIVTGRPVDSADGRVFLRSLEIAAAGRETMLPAQLWADVLTDEQHDFELALLPDTASLEVLRGSRHTSQRRGRPTRCVLRIQALVSTDLVNLAHERPRMRAGGQRRLELRELTHGLRDRSYEIFEMLLVGGERGRMYKEFPEDRTRLYMTLALAPAESNLTDEDCEERALAAIDPVWVTGDARRQLHTVSGSVSRVSTHALAGFRPWTGGSGWIKVGPRPTDGK